MNGIVNTANLSRVPPTVGFPISPPQNDEANEESFAWADDDTLESLPSTRTLQRGEDLQTVTQQAIQLLDLYVFKDPLEELKLLYRQHDVLDLNSSFQEHSLGKQLYSYSFECPLKGTIYHSSLPLPLFGNDTPHDLLEQLTQKVIGGYEIFHDGVFFLSKRHAKRAVALAVLESMGVSAESTVMYSSPQHAMPRLGQLSPTSVSSPLGMARTCPTRYFPSWVHELCRVGVRGKDLTISYQEQYFPSDSAWNEQPTLLSCIVSVNTLIELTSVGMPCSTKRKALESAVGLLVEELQRQLPNLQETQPPSTQELKSVLDCDPANASYVYPLPKWASAPMPSRNERELYLYELELKSSQGHALFGVVFPCDPEPQSETPLVFEVEFGVPNMNGDNTPVAVRLQKVRALDVSGLSDPELEARMSWMKSFNAMAADGRNGGDVETPLTNAFEFQRTYLLVPLTRTGFGTARKSSVDWNMLRHLWQQTENIDTKSSSSLRFFGDVSLVVLGLFCVVVPVMIKGVRKESGLNLVLFLLVLMIYTLLVHLPSKAPELSPFQLKMMQYIAVFMPLLERQLEVANFAAQLCDMASQIQAERSIGQPPDSLYERSMTLPNSLNEATTLVPNPTSSIQHSYQRLELLGDSVLGFFLSINLMGINCSLEWDSDDLARILSASANNRALVDAALRSGVCHLLCGDRQSFPSTDQSTVVKSLLSAEGIPTGNYTDDTLSAVVESLLGAAFLDGIGDGDPSGGRMVIALLERFNLPLPNHGTKSGLPFFQAAGPCVKTGYPFNQDKAWRRQLVQIGTTLYCEHEIINRLETGWLKLMGNIFSRSSFDRHRLLMEKQKAKILLLCSLFNDSLSNLSEEGSFRRMDSSFTTSSVSTLGSDLSSNPDSTVTPEGGLIRIALLRETLFMIGHSGLHLAITHELFRMYPDASEVDLSLQRACSTSDDAMAYIMVKNGFQQSLYHHATRSEKRFISEVGAAEDLGRKVWNRRFGWILKGGKHEYARRCASLSFPMPQGLPRYCGLAGGRFYGHNKSKLPDSLTEDFVFSFKAIAGALVLSLGLEGMWQSLGPLFGELLLLSADELRNEYRKNSSIVSRS